jgi:hypothetical protein
MVLGRVQRGREEWRLGREGRRVADWLCVTSLSHPGILFSSVGIIESVCTLLASVIYNSTYPVTRTIHHGFTFFMMGVALVLPFILMM